LLCVLGLQAPLEQQVEQLVGEGRFEEAINICAIFQNDQHHTALLASIDRASPPHSPPHSLTHTDWSTMLDPAIDLG
jgi:hypothetical protein